MYYMQPKDRKRAEPKFHPTAYQQAIHLLIHGTSVAERSQEFIARLDDGVLFLASLVVAKRRQVATELGTHPDLSLEEISPSTIETSLFRPDVAILVRLHLEVELQKPTRS